MSEEKIVTIRTYTYYNEGVIDKAKLESAGIPCVLTHDRTFIFQPFFSREAGGIRLQVRESDAVVAISILNDISTGNEINQSDSEYIEPLNKVGDDDSQNSESYRWGCVSMIIFALIALAYIVLKNYK